MTTVHEDRDEITRQKRNTVFGPTWIVRGPSGAVSYEQYGIEYHPPGDDECVIVGRCDLERADGTSLGARKLTEAYEKAGYDEAVIWAELESLYRSEFEVAS